MAILYKKRLDAYCHCHFFDRILVCPLGGERILYPSHFSDKSVSLGFIIVLNLGYIPSCVYCFRDGRWIWGSAQALLFLLYTLALIQLHI